MATYIWASPRKAFEYYLQSAGRSPADLWHAVSNGHIRVSIMDVEFSGLQVRALLKLMHFEIAEENRHFELPIWMSVHMDDVERVLCGEDLPDQRRGRPEKNRDESNREYRLAVEVSKLMTDGQASSVAEAARLLIQAGQVKGASFEAKLKKVQRAYARHFRQN
jgi:hypothetical protein